MFLLGTITYFPMRPQEGNMFLVSRQMALARKFALQKTRYKRMLKYAIE